MNIFKKIFGNYDFMNNKIINLKTDIPETPEDTHVANIGYIDERIHKIYHVENLSIPIGKSDINHNLNSTNIVVILRIYNTNSIILPFEILDDNNIRIESKLEITGELLIIKF